MKMRRESMEGSRMGERVKKGEQGRGDGDNGPGEAERTRVKERDIFVI